MNIYITRHGRTKWNDEGRMQGRLDSALTEDGIRNLKLLKKRIENINIDKIYSSPQKRALVSAEIIRGDRKIDIECLDGLMEVCFFSFEGRKISDIIVEDKEKFYDFENNPLKFNFDGRYPYVEAYKDASEAIEHIKKEDYKDVLLVTHGAKIRILRLYLEKRSLADINKLSIIKGGGLIKYRLNGEEAEFIFEDEDYDLIRG